MFSRLKAIAGTLIAMAIDSVDPVCQNRNAVILGEYNGFTVRLVPVEGADGCVESWIPDPREAQRIDAMLAANPGLAPAPQQPAPQQVTQQPAPPLPPLPQQPAPPPPPLPPLP